jgi:uncharacterized protein
MRTRLAGDHAAFGRRFRLAGLLLGGFLLAGCKQQPGAPAHPAAAVPPSIGALQGSGARSPYEGQAVALSGVVTGNFVNALDGFFMQDEAGAEDGDPHTADGVFVVWSREQQPKVRRGDRVRVRGSVAELGSGTRTQTALVDTEVEVLGRAGVAVTVLDTPPLDEADWERYEGMWLRIGVPLTVAGNYGLARFGELEVAFGGRPQQPTARYPVGERSRTRSLRNQTRMLVLDDNRRGEYPDRLWFLPEVPNAAQPLRAGSRLHEVEGVLDHRAGPRRLQLTAGLKLIEQAPRPPAPQIDGELRLATFNVWNYFNGDGQGGGFPTPRGAASAAEFERQTRKLVAMILPLAPDIAALVELENDGSGADSAEQQLVAALNAALGAAGDYQAVPYDREAAGSDLIRVGLIYRASRVRTVGPSMALNQPPFGGDDARPPLAQAFQSLAGGPAFTVAALHFKSKSRCHEVPAELPAEQDQGDGQSCWNTLRVRSAEALGSWLGGDPAGTGSGLAIMLGDFNANTFEDPLLALRRQGWRDAVDPGDREGYTYIFRGLANRLDHALLSPPLARRLAGAAVWHINADETPLFDYSLEHKPIDLYQPDPYRASDHDPLLVVLKSLR